MYSFIFMVIICCSYHGSKFDNRFTLYSRSVLRCISSELVLMFDIIWDGTIGLTADRPPTKG